VAWLGAAALAPGANARYASVTLSALTVPREQLGLKRGGEQNPLIIQKYPRQQTMNPKI
jgi:hypothetical protein